MSDRDSVDKHIYDLLEEFFEQKKWHKEQIDQFYQDFVEIAPFTSLKNLVQSLKKPLRVPAKISEDGKAGRPAGSQRVRRYLVRTAVDLGIPPSIFDNGEKVFVDDVSLVQQPDFLFIGDYAAPGFEEKYTKLIFDYLKRGTGKFSVHDYLGRGDRMIPTKGLPKYFDAHSPIFRAIEAKLEQNKDIEYIRILCLHIKEEIENTFVPVAEEIIRQCSLSCYYTYAVH